MRPMRVGHLELHVGGSRSATSAVPPRKVTDGADADLAPKRPRAGDCGGEPDGAVDAEHADLDLLLGLLLAGSLHRLGDVALEGGAAADLGIPESEGLRFQSGRLRATSASW